MKSKASRSIKVLSLLMVVLMIALTAAACGGNGSGSADSTEVLAEVGGTDITRGEVRAFGNIYAASMGVDPSYLTDGDYDSLLEDYAGIVAMKMYYEANGVTVIDEAAQTEIDDNAKSDEEMMSETLKSLGVTSEDYKNYETLLAVSRFFFEEMEEEMGPIDDLAKAEYENNKDQYTSSEDQVSASHILVETEAEANDIIAKIDAGEDFAELAKEFSTDPGSGANGGDLGYFTYGTMVEPFSEAAFALEIGEVSGAVKSDYGYHIIKCTGKMKEGDPLPYETAYDSICDKLYQEAYNAKLDKMVEEIGINYVSGESDAEADASEEGDAAEDTQE